MLMIVHPSYPASSDKCRTKITIKLQILLSYFRSDAYEVFLMVLWLSLLLLPSNCTTLTLESMDRLFSLPWYKIGLYGNEDAEAQDAVFDEKADRTRVNVVQLEGSNSNDSHNTIRKTS